MVYMIWNLKNLESNSTSAIYDLSYFGQIYLSKHQISHLSIRKLKYRLHRVVVRIKMR